MIAIPIDSVATNIKSSTLFGNANMFAIYKPDADAFFFIRNKEAGDGVATAKLLKKWEVKRVVYSYMGKGPFTELKTDGVGVYYIGKEPMSLREIVVGFQDNTLIEVTADNAKTYLDPGTQSGNCECSCST